MGLVLPRKPSKRVVCHSRVSFGPKAVPVSRSAYLLKLGAEAPCWLVEGGDA